MNPSRLFILRPVATSLLMAAILLAGLVAYRQLPVSALPEVDYPTIEVLTFYPGASPDVMTSSVTAPLEVRTLVHRGGFKHQAPIGIARLLRALRQHSQREARRQPRNRQDPRRSHPPETRPARPRSGGHLRLRVQSRRNRSRGARPVNAQTRSRGISRSSRSDDATARCGFLLSRSPPPACAWGGRWRRRTSPGG